MIEPKPLAIIDNGSSKCTFEVRLINTQNATWQGELQWLEQGVTQNFRSVLEMLTLMDEALAERAGSQPHAEWQS